MQVRERLAEYGLTCQSMITGLGSTPLHGGNGIMAMRPQQLGIHSPESKPDIPPSSLKGSNDSSPLALHYHWLCMCMCFLLGRLQVCKRLFHVT